MVSSFIRARQIAILAVVLLGCASSGGTHHGGTDGGTFDGSSVLPDAHGSDGSALDAGSGSDTGTGFDSGVTCAPGTASSITGTTFAPNGTDPLPHVLVYVTSDTETFPPAATSVECQQCTSTPAGALTSTFSQPNGMFMLTGDVLDAGGTFTVVIESGEFRHVERHVVVGICSGATLTSAQTKLPGATSGDDTIPRIAVAGIRAGGSGDVNDKFTHVLDILGMTGYDAIAPNRSGTTTGSSDLISLLSSAAMLNQYQILIVPCGALGAFSVASHITPGMLSNLQAWLAAGGRLYSSDLAYAVAQQSYPSGITFATGPSSRAGADPADVGTGLATGTSLTANVDDPGLAAWLQLVGAIPTGSTSIPIVDLKDPWGAVDAMPAAELMPMMGVAHGVVWVSGDVMWHTAGGGHHPLTVQADVPGTTAPYCGRLVFTSYHVESSTTATVSPQERVLEYLFFQLSECIQTLH